jgi:hypothetical protein
MRRPEARPPQDAKDDERALFQRAERAYERGRFLAGLRAAAFVIPLMLVSFGCCGRPSVSVFIAAALAVLVTVLVWRGGALARGVAPGYAAGILPLAVPLVALPIFERSGLAGVVPLAACVAGGIASGAIVAFYASREEDDKPGFVLSCGSVATLAGSLGCVIVGLGGVLAMAVGLVLVTPLAFRRTRTA